MSAHYGTGTPPTAPATALLHRLLGIGLVIVALAMVIVRYAGGIEDAHQDTLLAAYITSGVSFLMCAAALMFLKPLVPRRGAGKPLAAFWADPTVAPRALRFWFILEGAGVMASVSFFLGGGLIAAALIVLTVAVYWLNGPNVFAGE